MRQISYTRSRLVLALGLALLSSTFGAQAAPETKDAQPKQSGQLVIGKQQFQHPETALWDEQEDIYLVSNIHGMPTDADDNGFISRVSPNGEIIDLKWIDGARPDVVLHGPKGMLFHDGLLVVADVGGVRFFDRTTGKPVKDIPIPAAYLLNDPAVGPDGTLYVTDTGDEFAKHAGAIYRLTEDGAVILVQGKQLERPDGLHADDQGLLVTPFDQHADTLYRVDGQGKRTDVIQLPAGQLDGLLALEDGSYLVTSWASSKVYRVRNGAVETVGSDLPTPAQIGYDAKRRRVLVPVLKENLVRVFELNP